MRFEAIFYKRQGLARVSLTKCVVNSLEWAAVGGPSRASIKLQGGRLELWEAIDMLRCPVEVWDEYGQLAWNGFVSEVKVKDGAWEISSTIASMNNRVAVMYSFVEPGSNTVGVRKTTDWIEDAASVSEFGVKELMSSQDGLSDAAAVGRRNAILAEQRWPGSQVRYSGALGNESVDLICTGWWNTLSWRYANVTGVAEVATTTQISNLINSYGQFFTGCVIQTASGISSSEYRDGNKTVQEEIEALLESGTTEGKRLLAWVDEGRRVLVREEPLFTNAAYSVFRTGKVMKNTSGQEANPKEIVGNWVKLVDIAPVTADFARMTDPRIQFVEGVKWTQGGTQLQFRGQKRIEDMFAVHR